MSFYPAIHSIGRDAKFTVAFFFMYGYRFLSRGFTDWSEILHGGSATSQTGFLPFGGIAPGMAEFWASTGAIWRDMLLAEALVFFIIVFIWCIYLSAVFPLPNTW